MARYALGIDVGGTKLFAAVVDLQRGKVIGSAKKKMSKDDGADELMERICAAVDAAIKDAKIKKDDLAGIGVGIAGQVDAELGMLIFAPNLSMAAANIPMARHLTDRFGVPAALRNDVQIAAMGEERFGAGKGAADFLCVFVGTGVGGAMVRNGELVSGAAGAAGEIGHLVIDAGGRMCGCGGHGHLEAYASRTAITKSLLGELRRGRQSIITELVPELDVSADFDAPGGTAIRSGALAKAVESQDELVLDTLREAGRYLGLGLASAINLLNPTRIILGGGVIEAVDLLFEVARTHAQREALPTSAKSVEMVRAGLGDNAGVVGAAILGGRTANAAA